MPKRGYRFVAPVREIFAGDEQVLLARRTRASVIIKEVDEEQEAAGEQVPMRRRELDSRKLYLGMSFSSARF